MAELSRRSYLRTALAVGVVANAGCITDGDASGTDTGTAETPGEPTGQIDEPPDLLVLADGQTDGGNNHAGRKLVRFSFDEERSTYEVATTFSPGNGQQVTSFAPFQDGYAVVVGEGAESADEVRLVVLDAAMDRRAARHLSGNHSVATDGDVVYTAYEDGFVSFDAELTRLGAVGLPEELAGKHMEDVLIHDDVAYVVDNIIEPAYLFRIDVSDPADPAYLEVLETFGTYQSLHQQWLTPDANRWQFLQTTSHREGGEQSVGVTPMTGAATDGAVEGPDGAIARRDRSDIHTLETHAWTREGIPEEIAEDRDHGIRIEDVSTFPPVYAAIDDGEDTYLASVTTSERDVTITRQAPLEEPARVDTSQETAAALARDGRLTLFDVDDRTVGHVETLRLGDLLELVVLG